MYKFYFYDFFCRFLCIECVLWYFVNGRDVIDMCIIIFGLWSFGVVNIVFSEFGVYFFIGLNGDFLNIFWGGRIILIRSIL